MVSSSDADSGAVSVLKEAGFDSVALAIDCQDSAELCLGESGSRIHRRHQNSKPPCSLSVRTPDMAPGLWSS